MITLYLLESTKMATVQPPVDARADDVDDVGVIWKEAIVRYEINNKCKIQSLDGASSVNEILIKIRNAEKNFDLYRHDGSRLNRLMTLVSKSLNLVDKISNVVASAASTVRRISLPFVDMMTHIAIVLPSQHCHLHSCPLFYRRMLHCILMPSGP